MHWLAAVAQTTATPTGGGLKPSWLPWWVVQVAGTVSVVALAWLVSQLVVRLLGRRLAQRFERPSITRTVLRGLTFGIYVLGFFAILRIWGLRLGNIALSVTVFSAVVGVILAPIVGSIISGVFLLADQPYEIGDMIELSDGGGEARRGFVENITLRYTKIFTLDNTFLVVPNGKIRERDVFNYSAEDTRTRQSLDVLITYESDVEAAQNLIERAARKTDGIIEGGPRIRIGAARYPAQPDCLISAFGDHGVQLRLRYWVAEPYRLQTVKSALQERIWAALDDADVEIAYPHSHLYFDETSGQLDLTLDQQDPRDRRQTGVPERRREERDEPGDQ